MLHHIPQHVLSSTVLIFRRTNCTTVASGIITLEIDSSSPISRVTIPDAAVIQFILLKMSTVLLETCQGL